MHSFLSASGLVPSDLRTVEKDVVVLLQRIPGCDPTTMYTHAVFDIKAKSQEQAWPSHSDTLYYFILGAATSFLLKTPTTW